MTHDLEADGIHLDFSLKRILSDVYIRCTTGMITGLLGRNGEGKTCLMNIIYGNLNVADKSIRFDKMAVSDAYKKPGLIACLPQFNFISKTLTLKRIFSDFEIDFSTFVRHFPALGRHYKHRLSNLSGGDRRIVEIFVILKSDHRFILLDEPFSHLMPIQVQRMREIIVEEKEKKGILITDHLYREVMEISDMVYLLKSGKTYKINAISEIESLGYAHL